MTLSTTWHDITGLLWVSLVGPAPGVPALGDQVCCAFLHQGQGESGHQDQGERGNPASPGTSSGHSSCKADGWAAVTKQTTVTTLCLRKSEWRTLTYSRAILSQNFCENPIQGFIHMLLVAENEVSLFLFLSAGFSSCENKEEKTPDGEPHIVGRFRKTPLEFVQTDKRVIFHLIALILGFRDAQLCCSNSFIKNLWGGKRSLRGPVWFHYPWDSTQTEQGCRRLEMAVCGTGGKWKPLEASSTDHTCSNLPGDLTESRVSIYNLVHISQSLNHQYPSQKTDTHLSPTFNLSL